MHNLRARGFGSESSNPGPPRYENVSRVQSHAKCHIRVERAIKHPFFCFSWWLTELVSLAIFSFTLLHLGKIIPFVLQLNRVLLCK